MATYRTNDGDVLDRICFDWYGRRPGAVEAVLEANPGLAKQGPVFAAGVLIELPDLPAPVKDTGAVRLWD